MDLSKWNVVFCVTTLVERNDVFVSVVWHDVCQAPHGAHGSEIESDVKGVVAVVEFPPVWEDDLE